MTADNQLRAAILDCIAPGSLDVVTVVDRLADRWSEQQIRDAIDELVDEGTLEPHPATERVYRVVDDVDPGRLRRIRALTRDRDDHHQSD